MPTSTNVTNLKINTLTKAQYDTAVQGGVIGANELSIITDLDDAIQVSTLPTAAAGEEGKIYQFIGTTDASYTHGYFYECVSDGQPTPTYSWSQVNVQPTPSGLPSQTGQSGKFLTTDGTDASWSDKPLVNTATGTNSLTLLGTANTNYQEAVNIGSISKVTAAYGVAIGRGAEANGQYATAIGGWSPKAGGTSSIAIGDPAQATENESIAIGSNAKAQASKSTAIGSGAVVGSWANNAIQLGVGTNSTANTFSVGLSNANNYRLLNSDGTIPKERLTNVVTIPSTAPVLAVADWSSNTQTITVTGVTASNTVFVAPAPASAADYAAAGILCTAQASNSLTFTCTTVPSNAITLSVVILG